MTRIGSCRIIQFMNANRPPDLADHAIAQASASAPLPWSDRTAENVEIDGHQWAVIVDWAILTDGTRVPASVTLSSLGAVLTEHPADVEPRAVTRGIINRMERLSWCPAAHRRSASRTVPCQREPRRDPPQSRRPLQTPRRRVEPHHQARRHDATPTGGSDSDATRQEARRRQARTQCDDRGEMDS
jgi:hypothetical protein